MRFLVLLAACWCAGCVGRSVVGASDEPADAADVPVDEGVDAGTDLGTDVGFDLGAPVDVPPDVPALDLVEEVAADLGAPGDRPDAPAIPTDLGMLAANARCDNALALGEDSALDAQDLSLAAFRAEGCFAFPTGPALYYRATVPSFDTLEITVRPSSDGPMFRPVVRVLPTCNSDRCITQGVGTTTGLVTRWTNFSDNPQTVLLAVSNQLDMAAGRFRIATTVGRQPRNVLCSRATVVTPGTPLTNVSFGDASDVLPVCAGSMQPAAGPTLYYRVTVPAGEVLTALSRPSAGATTAPMLRVVADCGVTTCLADSGRAGSPSNVLTWTNGPAARDVVLTASAYPVTANTSRFDLSVSTIALPTNLTCAAAAPLTGGSPHVEGSTTFGTAAPRTCADNVAAGNALWYRATVPARSFLLGRVTRLAGAGLPELRLYGACDGACLNPAARATGTPGETRWLNASDSPVPVFLAVSSSPGNVTSFALDVSFVAVAPNATCGSATALTVGTYLPDVDLAGAAETVPVCAGLTVLNAGLYYRVTVPAGRTLVVQSRRTVAAAGDTAWSPALRILPACAASTCHAISSLGAEDFSVSAVYRAAGSADEEVLVALSRSTAGFNGHVDLRLSLAPVADNARCQDATLIGPVERREALPVGEGGPLQTFCRGTSTGGTLYYRVRVPAGGSLVAVSQRQAGLSWTPAMELDSSCDAATCLASSTLVAGNATMIWRNPDAAEREVRLSVAASVRVPAGVASLSVTVAPPRYRVDPITPSCERVDSTWTDLNLRANNAVTPVQPLPFPFSYFNVPVTHHSVGVNGTAQLWPSAAGAPNGTGNNGRFPWPASPPGMIAPLWDGFAYNPSAQIVAHETTGVGRHYTVSWSGLTIEGDRADFQLQLYAETHVIEFHYCRLDFSIMNFTTAGAGTVGMQNVAGTEGIELGFNMARTIEQSVATRFTPIR